MSLPPRTHPMFLPLSQIHGLFLLLLHIYTNTQTYIYAHTHTHNLLSPFSIVCMYICLGLIGLNWAACTVAWPWRNQILPLVQPLIACSLLSR